MTFRSSARPHYSSVRALSGRPISSIKPTIDSNLPPFARVNTGIRSSSDYLRQQMVGMGMGGTRAKSASSSSLPPPIHNGRMTSAYGEFGGNHRRMHEDVEEELMSVKRNFATLVQENASLKTRLKRIDDEAMRKDKHLDELLNQNQAGPLNGFAFSQGAEGRLLTNSLKQKIMRLEQSVKDKDTQLRKLKSDGKMTKIQEMRIQLDSFYQEIMRLKYQSGSVGDHAAPDIPKQLSAKMKSLNETIVRQNETHTKLISENRMLKEQLESLAGGAGETDTDYDEWEKSKLIALIQKLQRELEAVKENDGKSSTSRSDREKLDTLVKRLKEDRQHYKNKVEIKDKEIEALKKKLRDAEQELKEANGALKAAKSRLNSGSLRAEPLNSERSEQRVASARKTESRSSTRSKSHRSPSPPASEINSPVRSSRPTSSRHSAESSTLRSDAQPRNVERIEQFRRNHAAKTIQKHWKRYQEDEALDVIAATARGHLARQRYLADQDASRRGSSAVDELSGDESPTSVIGGAVKGHLTRLKHS
uniref:IQ domain-containing protein E n=1 Tax=Plectus sambesii TaxID=2011161 RepID=A0A914VLD2_9BILA